MVSISSQQMGITHEELQEAVPDTLLSKDIHLHWVDKSPSGNGNYTLTAKLGIDGEVLLLKSKTTDEDLIEHWDNLDPSFHTNTRLIAFERILTDPANEDILLSL